MCNVVEDEFAFSLQGFRVGVLVSGRIFALFGFFAFVTVFNVGVIRFASIVTRSFIVRCFLFIGFFLGLLVIFVGLLLFLLFVVFLAEGFRLESNYTLA